MCQTTKKDIESCRNSRENAECRPKTLAGDKRGLKLALNLPQLGMAKSKRAKSSPKCITHQHCRSTNICPHCQRIAQVIAKIDRKNALHQHKKNIESSDQRTYMGSQKSKLETFAVRNHQQRKSENFFLEFSSKSSRTTTELTIFHGAQTVPGNIVVSG